MLPRQPANFNIPPREILFPSWDIIRFVRVSAITIIIYLWISGHRNMKVKLIYCRKCVKNYFSKIDNILTNCINLWFSTFGFEPLLWGKITYLVFKMHQMLQKRFWYDNFKRILLNFLVKFCHQNYILNLIHSQNEMVHLFFP